MRFARQHPYYGWLFLEPDDYRRIYNQLIQMRDADLKKGDNSSGFPSGFPEWCEDDIKELAKEDKYKKRIATHLEQLKISIENRRREIANTYLMEELKKMEAKAELMEGLVGS
jgi:16S rRNA C967 or C1407 C5-methylase (RsmB/RsmF family)